jgi:hypothetical protein
MKWWRGTQALIRYIASKKYSALFLTIDGSLRFTALKSTYNNIRVVELVGIRLSPTQVFRTGP